MKGRMNGTNNRRGGGGPRPERCAHHAGVQHIGPHRLTGSGNDINGHLGPQQGATMAARSSETITFHVSLALGPGHQQGVIGRF